MAKLNGPLFSLGASGAIAKTLVYFPWKGINSVRRWLVPANPQSAAQTTQRGYFTEAVDAVHAALADATHPFTEADKTGYALLGSTHPTPRTWFNECVKGRAAVRVAGNIPVLYKSEAVTDTTANSINLILYIQEATASQLASGKFWFGTSRTALIHSIAATVTPGTSVALANADCSAFLTAGVKYFFQFRPDAADPCEGALSGIYTFTAS